jgi:hypothetical protein
MCAWVIPSAVSALPQVDYEYSGYMSGPAHLSQYMRDAKVLERGRSTGRVVVGCLVVMYNNGRGFHVEQTTDPYSTWYLLQY